MLHAGFSVLTPAAVLSITWIVPGRIGELPVHPSALTPDLSEDSVLSVGPLRQTVPSRAWRLQRRFLKLVSPGAKSLRGTQDPNAVS